ncbi:MAG: class I SAM-dependent methyltransferase [Anaerolineae bacterium]|nr:class I SAM-dependent methyltransferase [Anaerolineae bacterium]
MLDRFFLRVFMSRYGKSWLRRLSAKQAEKLLLFSSSAVFAQHDSKSRYAMLREFSKRRGLYKVPLMASWEYARVFACFRMVEQIKDVPGDIVEFGVGRGISLAYFSYAVSWMKLNKMVYGFDSFEGFPEAAVEDISNRSPEVGKPPSGWQDTSPELIHSIFELDKVKEGAQSLIHSHDVTVKLFKGFFQDTVSDESLPPKIALIHVDCDMYESTKFVLEKALPRMQPGGLVIFDEYGDENWPGEKQAADQVAQELKLAIVYFDYAQKYGIVIPDDFQL